MNTNAFALRHIGPREEDQNLMLKTIGVNSLDQLITETIPNDIRLKNGLNLDEPMSEYEYLLHIHELSKKNKAFILAPSI
jgi:glycine dehydrogenase